MSLIDLTNNSQGLDVHIRDLKCRYFTTKLGPISDVYNDVKKIKENEKKYNEILQILVKENKDNIDEIKNLNNKIDEKYDNLYEYIETINKYCDNIDDSIEIKLKNFSKLNYDLLEIIQNCKNSIETISSTNTQLLDQNTLLTSQINSIVTELDKLKKDNERFELQEKYYKDREQKMAQLLNIDTKKL